jgi:ankyrin repeat protein
MIGVWHQLADSSCGRQISAVFEARRMAAIGISFLFAVSAMAGPVHDAARAGDSQTVTRLLDQGANIEDREPTGETPLIAAALAGQTQIVELLLDRHAAIEARNDRGLTPLHAAAYGGHADTVAALLEHGAAVDDNQNRYHTTPLIIAAEDGHTDIVKLLIAKGANLEAVEANGYSALTQAWGVYKWDTVDALLKAGANCQPKEVVGEAWATECNKRKK